MSGARFGAELRRRRLAAGLSLIQLAELVHYHKSFLSRVERGDRAPAVGLARRCDVVLRADGQLAALVPAAESLGHRGATDDAVPAAVVEPLYTGVDGVRDGQGRLRVLAPDGPTLDHFSSLFQELRTQGHRITPLLVYPALVRHANLLKDVVETAAGPVRVRLQRLLAHYYEYASWMAQEVGRDDIASRLIAMAARFGATSGADYLVPYAMIRKADIALYRGNGREVVDLAVGAAHHSSANHRVRMAADQRQAQGFAMLCDRRACETALARADRRLAAERPQPHSAIPLGSTATRSTNDLVRGWCYFDLGQPDEAAEALQQGLAAVPAHALRARALYGARLAVALAAGGQVERACAHATGVLGISTGVDSATVRHQLRRLHMVLKRWHMRSAVRELQAQLVLGMKPG